MLLTLSEVITAANVIMIKDLFEIQEAELRNRLKQLKKGYLNVSSIFMSDIIRRSSGIYPMKIRTWELFYKSLIIGTT